MNIDEVGWKVQGDNGLGDTVMVNNVHRTRMVLILTVPPSEKVPDKNLLEQAKKWFKK